MLIQGDACEPFFVFCFFVVVVVVVVVVVFCFFFCAVMRGLFE